MQGVLQKVFVIKLYKASGMYYPIIMNKKNVVFRYRLFIIYRNCEAYIHDMCIRNCKITTMYILFKSFCYSFVDDKIKIVLKTIFIRMLHNIY